MAKKLSASMKKDKISLTEVEPVRKKSKERAVFRPNADRTVKIEISTKTIFIALALIVAFVVWKQIVPVLAIVFFALIISSATLPVIRWLISKKIPKTLAIFLVYVLVFFLIAFAFAIVIVPLFQELKFFFDNFAVNSEMVLNKIVELNIPFVDFDKEAIKQAVGTYINDLSSGLIPFLAQGLEGALKTLNTLAGILSGLLSLVTCLTLSIYIVADQDYILDIILTRFFTDTKKTRIKKLVLDVESKLGKWVTGQAVLSTIIGVMVWILLSVMDVPLALPLAVMAGLLESVPTLGPIISSVPAILIATISGGPVWGLLVAVGYILIQQLENNLIVPRIMGSAVGLRPIVVLVGLLFGFSLGNVIGALLTVPILGVAQILLDFYFDLQKMKAKGIV